MKKSKKYTNIIPETTGLSIEVESA